MTGSVILAAALALGAPPERGDNAVPRDWDVLFLADEGPVRVRVSLGFQGESIEKRWAEQVRHVFEYFDRDGDKLLDQKELDFVYTAAGVERLMSGSVYFRAAVEKLPVSDVDRDGDEKVSFEELTAYYAPAAKQLISTTVGIPNDERSLRLTAGLFERLDRNRDKKLDREEVGRLRSLVALLDGNEDECLGRLELVPDLYSSEGGGEMMAMIPQLMRLANAGGGHRRHKRR